MYLVLLKTLMMDKSTNKSTTPETDHQRTDKKSLFVGGLIVILIVISPLIFYSYKGFPDNSQSWETFLFKIDTSFYSMYDYAWYFVGKLVPLYLLLLWFFTCKHWWYWILLVPIAMYAFQLWGIINDSSRNIDELELYFLLPLMAVLTPAVYLIRAKLFQSLTNNDLASFEKELQLEKSTWQQIKDLFN